MTQSDTDGALASMDLKDFILTLGSRSPSPGGGSVAALASSVVSSANDIMSSHPLEARVNRNKVDQNRR